MLDYMTGEIGILEKCCEMSASWLSIRMFGSCLSSGLIKEMVPARMSLDFLYSGKGWMSPPPVDIGFFLDIHGRMHNLR